MALIRASAKLEGRDAGRLTSSILLKQDWLRNDSRKKPREWESGAGSFRSRWG